MSTLSAPRHLTSGPNTPPFPTKSHSPHFPYPRPPMPNRSFPLYRPSVSAPLSAPFVWLAVRAHGISNACGRDGVCAGARARTVGDAGAHFVDNSGALDALLGIEDAHFGRGVVGMVGGGEEEGRRRVRGDIFEALQGEQWIVHKVRGGLVSGVYVNILRMHSEGLKRRGVNAMKGWQSSHYPH
jgi:hypothetical protein